MYPITVLGYVVAAVAPATAAGGARGAQRARWLVPLVWLLHSALMVSMVTKTGSPMATRAGSALCLSWMVVLVALVVEWRRPLQLLPSFVLPAVVALLVLAAVAEDGTGPGRRGTPTPGWVASSSLAAGARGPSGQGPGTQGAPVPGATMPGEGEPSSPVGPRTTGAWATGAETGLAGNPWVWFHALAGLGSYAAFTVAAALGVMYLVLERQLRCKAFTTLYLRLPPLDVMDRAAAWSMGAGLLLFTLTLLGGTVGAELWWGPRWIRDGKVLVSLGAWCFYAGTVAFRISRGWGGRRFAYLSILAFVGAMANYLLVGPHWSQYHVF